MVRSDLIIAGSNFIFSHISQNYSHLLNSKKKLLVIFRGINVDYYNPDTVKESDEKKLIDTIKKRKENEEKNNENKDNYINESYKNMYSGLPITNLLSKN